MLVSGCCEKQRGFGSSLVSCGSHCFPTPVQELVLELRCRPKLLPGCSAAQRPLVFELLQGRLAGRDPEQGSALGQQLWRQQELLLHRR